MKKKMDERLSAEPVVIEKDQIRVGLGDQEHDIESLVAFKHALDCHSIVAVTDPKGIITYANEKFCEISQYSKNELIGQDHRILNSGYHSKRFIQGLWSTLKAGTAWQGTFRNRAKDGSYYWVQSTIHPVIKNNKIINFVAIRTDITEIISLKEKEQKLNFILKETAEKLKIERLALNNKNIALNELIDNIEAERDRIKQTIGQNFETLVNPLLNKLIKRTEGVNLKYLHLIDSNLKEIATPFLPSSIQSKLTPKELEVCNHIKHGMTVKEIAAFYNLSPRTIDKHRENIRKKLGLVEKKINLTMFLKSH
ncbi:MAG: PAS domain S-box protein [Bdellovibrionota bacterium]